MATVAPEEVYNRATAEGPTALTVFVVVCAIAVLVSVLTWYIWGSSNNGAPTVVIIDTEAQLTNLCASNEVFLMAYTPTCGHCTAALPEFEAASAQSTGVTFAKVDVTQHQQIAQRLKLSYVPFLCRMKTLDKYTEYTGERTSHAITAHLAST